MKRLLTLALFFSLALAQEAEGLQNLKSFLGTLQTHPAIVASASLVSASRAQRDAIYFPVSGELSGGYNRLFVDTTDATLPPGFEESELSNAFQFSATARFRPFVFGDIADLAKQREIDLAKSQLSYRETLASLEAQALEAAAQVGLAQSSYELAKEALDLSASVLSITETRLEKGAASDADLRTAQANLLEAQNSLRSAELNLELARRGLANLVGEANLGEMPKLEPVTGTLPDVSRAQLDAQLASVGVGNSQRGLFPVGQVSYTLPIAHEETVTDALGNESQQKAVNSELSLSLESRTLQPSLSYSYQNPKQTVAGFAAQPQLGLGLADLQGSLSIGVSLSISPDALAQLEAANAQLNAAQARLQATQDGAAITELTLNNNLETSQLKLELAKAQLANAELALDDSQKRLELGLATELDLKQAELALTQAKLAQLSANFSYLQAVLATYRSYAIPVSEALQ
ncbi:MAG: TolC family protein [Trueperaceae bacterium]|nr:TolC family protein [Trueperaceae bacterium]